LAKDQKEGKPEDEEQGKEDGHDDKDFADLLQELRILLQGVQVMTAFLVILPFSQGFKEIDEVEKWVFLATFICSISGLIFFSAPAAVHRLARPLKKRERFKDFSTRMTIVGLVPASLSLVLATQLVVDHVLGADMSYIAAGVVLLLIAILWWALPLALREKI
jgi:O-antigen/teichoic acid export membrane protein